MTDFKAPISTNKRNTSTQQGMLALLKVYLAEYSLNH